MTLKTSLIIASGVLLLVGLLLALGANYYQARAIRKHNDMEDVRGRPRDPEYFYSKEHLKGADRFYLAGVVLTAIGVIVQTVASLLP